MENVIESEEKQMECRCCSSTSLLKNGKTKKGVQRFICKSCYSITLEVAEVLRFTQKQKDLVKLMYCEQYKNIEEIAKQLQTEKRNISSLIKKNKLERNKNSIYMQIKEIWYEIRKI